MYVQMKKDKLYTVTKGNRSAIVDRINHNIFDGLTFGQSNQMNNPFGIKPLQVNTTPYINWGNSTQRALALGQSKAIVDSFGKGNPINLNESNKILSQVLGKINGGSSSGMFGAGTLGGSLLGAAGTVGHQVAENVIGGDYDSGVADAVSGVGGLVAKGVGIFNPLAGALVDTGVGAVSGGLKRLIGMSTNEENLAKATNTISTGKNFRSAAATNEGLVNAPSFASVSRVYKGGLLRKGDGNRKDAAIHNDINDAIAFVDRSLENNRANIASDNINNQLAVYSAFGGPLDRISDDMGAIEYGFMSDYLTNKKKQVENQNKTPGISPMPFNAFGKGGKLFPYGGGMFSGSGAGGSWDDTTDTYPEVTNFNEAFDKAVSEGLPEFLFQGRRYNTQKENNPVREYNNRWVGQGRKANVKNPSKAYDRQAGPLGGPLAAIPMVTDTYIGSPERPPILDFNPYAMERGKMLPYSWSRTVDRPKNVKALGGDIQTNGADYSVGKVYNVSEEEANRLKAMGYEFTVINQ